MWSLVERIPTFPCFNILKYLLLKMWDKVYERIDFMLIVSFVISMHEKSQLYTHMMHASKQTIYHKIHVTRRSRKKTWSPPRQVNLSFSPFLYTSYPNIISFTVNFANIFNQPVAISNDTEQYYYLKHTGTFYIHIYTTPIYVWA